MTDKPDDRSGEVFLFDTTRQNITLERKIVHCEAIDNSTNNIRLARTDGSQSDYQEQIMAIVRRKITDSEEIVRIMCDPQVASKGLLNNRLYFNMWRCNGVRECADGADEANCTQCLPLLHANTSDTYPVLALHNGTEKNNGWDASRPTETTVREYTVACSWQQTAGASDYSSYS